MSGIVYAAVVDSYFSDFHCTAVIGTCIDAQAIAGGTGDLPQGDWKIENNFLEGAAETILFGGAGGTAVPTDITIRFNHMFKPLNWMPGQPNFIGATNTDPTKCLKDPANPTKYVFDEYGKIGCLDETLEPHDGRIRPVAQ